MYGTFTHILGHFFTNYRFEFGFLEISVHRIIISFEKALERSENLQQARVVNFFEVRRTEAGSVIRVAQCPSRSMLANSAGWVEVSLDADLFKICVPEVSTRTTTLSRYFIPLLLFLFVRCTPPGFSFLHFSTDRKSEEEPESLASSEQFMSQKEDTT